MIIEKFIVGPLDVNCYIISHEGNKEAIIIDPGDEPDRIIEYIREKELSVKKIVYTHTHFDHVGALPELKEATGAELMMHKEEFPIYDAARDMAAFWGYQIDPLPKPDVLLSEGDHVTIGDLSFQVLHTPGHSPGSICLYGEGILITGDTLFAGSVGRTDLEGGSLENLKTSFKRLMALPEGTHVLPGHGPESTIGEEKRFNFFLGEL